MRPKDFAYLPVFPKPGKPGSFPFLMRLRAGKELLA